MVSHNYLGRRILHILFSTSAILIHNLITLRCYAFASQDILSEYVPSFSFSSLAPEERILLPVTMSFFNLKDKLLEKDFVHFIDTFNSNMKFSEHMQISESLSRKQDTQVLTFDASHLQWPE